MSTKLIKKRGWGSGRFEQNQTNPISLDLFLTLRTIYGGVSPQSQPLLHLPEKTCVELVQRLEGGDDGALQRVWRCLILFHCTLKRLRSQMHACSELSSDVTWRNLVYTSMEIYCYTYFIPNNPTHFSTTITQRDTTRKLFFFGGGYYLN